MAAASVITDKELLQDIVQDRAPDYTVITTISGTAGRWSIHQETIFRRDSDGKLFSAYWNRGATEYQDSDYPEEAVECGEQLVTVTKYVRLPTRRQVQPQASKHG